MKTQSPKISVLVIAICGESYLLRCLAALHNQVDVCHIEIVVAYDIRLRNIHEVQDKYPEIKMVTLEDMDTPEELSTLGINKTNGDIIAMTEDHCIPKEDWCKNIQEAYPLHHAAIGGVVDVSMEDAVSWALAYGDYYRYLPGTAEGPTQYFTVCNVAYKRSALEKIAKLWGNKFHEVTVNERLIKEGETLWLTPKLYVRQERKTRFLRAMVERYSFGILFGATRAVETPQKRAFYLAMSPIVPFLLIYRIAKSLLLQKKSHYPFFLKAMPILSIFTFAWSFGEFLGNILGNIPKKIYLAKH